MATYKQRCRHFEALLSSDAKFCGKCGESLLKQCNNMLCSEMQFFSNKKSTACGRAF